MAGIQVGRIGNRGSIRGRNKEFPFRVGDLIYVWYRKFSLGTREKCGKSVSKQYKQIRLEMDLRRRPFCGTEG